MLVYSSPLHCKEVVPVLHIWQNNVFFLGWGLEERAKAEVKFPVWPLKGFLWIRSLKLNLDLIGRMPFFLPGRLGWWWSRRLLFHFPGRSIISIFMHIFLPSRLGNWVDGEVGDFCFVLLVDLSFLFSCTYFFVFLP